ncbi:MAG: hypothetical protein WAN04_15230 [Candidatus Udaeobacter sp.]
MNALARWKILLALIATFAIGAITGGFLTGRVANDAVRRAEQPHLPSTLTADRLQRELHLNSEQVNKMGPILTQMENELNNLRSLDVRESDGIFARAKDRMDPIVASDRRSRLQEIIDEHRRRFEETPWIVERPR